MEGTSSTRYDKLERERQDVLVSMKEAFSKWSLAEDRSKSERTAKVEYDELASRAQGLMRLQEALSAQPSHGGEASLGPLSPPHWKLLQSKTLACIQCAPYRL